MKNLNWSTYYHIVITETIMLMHKCIFENTPSTITELITISLNRSENIRSVQKPMVINQTNSIKEKQTIIYK